MTPNSHETPNASTTECDLIRREGLYQGDQVKMSSIGRVLT